MTKKEKKDNLIDKTKDFLTFSTDNSDKNKDRKKKSNSSSSGYEVISSKPGVFARIKGFFQGYSSPSLHAIASRRTWRDEWPEYMDNYQDVYEQVSVVRKCINLISDFSVSIGFDVKTDNDKLKEEIEKMWEKTNFAEVIKKAIKKREIWGNAAFQISKNSNGDIVDFVPMHPERLSVKIDPDTMQIDHFEYRLPSSGVKKIDVKDVFYVSLDALDARKTGVSSLESIKTTVKMKWNLQKDLEQAAKRLWAPYAIFKYNTSYVKDKEKQKKEMKRFTSKIKPGKTIVHNQQVEPNIINMTPDLRSLIESIRHADEEIIGNWGVPKALLSRERSEDQSTLEFSIKTLYEGPVKSIQQYFKHEIETQIYSQIAENYDIVNYDVEHLWKATHFKDSPTIRALTYAVKEGVISPDDMVKMLGWNVFNLPDSDNRREKRDRIPVGDRPVSMSELKKILYTYEDEEAVKKLEEELEM